MSYSLTAPRSLVNIILTRDDALAHKLLFGLAGVIVLVIASQISVPMLPVPLTFQSATVILLGMAYGPRYGTYIVLSYLTAGICGIPVFAELSAGPHVMAGPTGGYLLGLVPAAFISGYLAQFGFAKNILLSFIAACVGVCVIFACGLLQLSQFIGWQNAFMMGLMPFIASEPIKLAAVAVIIPRLWKAS